MGMARIVGNAANDRAAGNNQWLVAHRRLDRFPRWARGPHVSSESTKFRSYDSGLRSRCRTNSRVL